MKTKIQNHEEKLRILRFCELRNILKIGIDSGFRKIMTIYILLNLVRLLNFSI